jgi:hypothetical protein
MKLIKKLVTFILILSIAAALGLWSFIEYLPYGFTREVEIQEKTIRSTVVATAEKWVGTQEGDSGHLKILEIYNSHEPLAQDYSVKPEDNWCAAFASAIAIECAATDIIPTECGCQRQIDLWKKLGRWNEDDNYLPLPGDYIYYAWDEEFSFGDCASWADHVGIVAGTFGPIIKVIEGNWSDSVTYHYVLQGDYQIRGYALPDYASKCP